MRIIIDYESSWRNSFLEGNNNEPLPKTGRKFIGSMTSLRKPENLIKREVTLDTVMGVLNRLIGDQRKLYQSRSSSGYFFKDIESQIKFIDHPKVLNNEMTYIRNVGNSTDQNSYSGLIKINDPMLTSDFSKELWSILALDFDEVCDFILNNKFKITKEVSLLPEDIVSQTELLDKNKVQDNEGVCSQVVCYLNTKFSELISVKNPQPYVEKNEKIKPIRFYAAALYIQLERLSIKFDMSKATTKAGKLAGFSKRGFNGRRDFMKNFVTGGEKKIWGNPYAIKEFKSLVPKMTKVSGQLEICIDIERTKAKEIKQMIDNAGVSSFYLGKKGLAYVSKITTRGEN